MLNSFLVLLFEQSLKITVILLLMVNLILVFPAQAESYSVTEKNFTNLSLAKGFPQAGPVYNLGGGGLDIDDAIQWMINQVRGCNSCANMVDVVIIRESGDTGYNQAISAMDGVESVKTLFIINREDATKENIPDQIQDAEVIFFAGGDQCQYLRNYRNTRVDQAVKSVIAKGGAIGGTSAGAMIQSYFVFNACSDTVSSETALQDPYEDIILNQGLFNWENFQNTIIDTHFYERDRMGRLITFIARLLRDGISDSILGIGIDENTSLIVDKNGLAKVVGDEFVYFVLGDHLPEECEPQTALNFRGLKVWKRGEGETFNLNNRLSNDDYYQISVENGQLNSTPY